MPTENCTHAIRKRILWRIQFFVWGVFRVFKWSASWLWENKPLLSWCIKAEEKNWNRAERGVWYKGDSVYYVCIATLMNQSTQLLHKWGDNFFTVESPSAYIVNTILFGLIKTSDFFQCIIKHLTLYNSANNPGVPQGSLSGPLKSLLIYLSIRFCCFVCYFHPKQTV